MDIVSICCGQHSPEIILRHADIEVIINRVILKKINTDTTGYRIFIPEYHHVDFFHRLCKEIEKGNAWQVFSHCQLEIEWVQKAMTGYLEKKNDSELHNLFFQVEDKEGDRHRKLRLKLIEIWAQIQDTKPVNIECHTFLELIVSNAFEWILGKGLFEILMFLEKRLCSKTHIELSKTNSLCTIITILGGNVKTYSWILKARKGRNLWQNMCHTFFVNKYLMQDFDWAVITGQSGIVEILLNNEICKTSINKSMTSYDMLNITGKLFGYSVYEALKELSLIKCIQQFVCKQEILGDKIVDFDIDDVSYDAEMKCTEFYTEDEYFNKLFYKKFKSDIEPIILTMYQDSVDLQCSQFPPPKSILQGLFRRTESTHTYIAWAAIFGHESVVDLLLQNGASPNKISLPSNNFPGSTSTFPVVYAAMYGRFNIVKRLLRNGATIESTGPYSCTLLIFASSYGHYDLVKYLLDRHVDINATNMFQNTALLYASKKGHTNIVNLLLENGALTNTVCNKSSTPLIEAASKGHLEIVEKLLCHFSSVNASNNKNLNALTKAAKNGHYNIVKRLIENQTPVNIRTHKNETALIIACRKGHLTIVSILMKHISECLNNFYSTQENESSTLENENKRTFSQLPFALCSPLIPEVDDEINQAFLNAYQYKHVGIMKILLDNGANVQIQFFCTSCTLLNDAVSEGEYEIVKLLLQNGARVHKRANYGISPLMFASFMGHTDIVTIILKQESYINSKSEHLPIPLTTLERIWMQRNSHKSDFKRNTAVSDINGTALIYATESSSLKLIELILQEKNVNINTQTYFGRTALMIACGSCREKLVAMLLHYNADVNITSRLGATALDIASIKRLRNENIIRALLRNGAIYSPEENQVIPVYSVDLQYVLNRMWFFLRFIFIFVLSKLILFC